MFEGMKRMAVRILAGTPARTFDAVPQPPASPPLDVSAFVAEPRDLTDEELDRLTPPPFAVCAALSERLAEQESHRFDARQRHADRLARVLRQAGEPVPPGTNPDAPHAAKWLRDLSKRFLLV